jgi:hypothetical protein
LAIVSTCSLNRRIRRVALKDIRIDANRGLGYLRRLLEKPHRQSLCAICTARSASVPVVGYAESQSRRLIEYPIAFTF